jgi:hypothetical protein
MLMMGLKEGLLWLIFPPPQKKNRDLGKNVPIAAFRSPAMGVNPGNSRKNVRAITF